MLIVVVEQKREQQTVVQNQPICNLKYDIYTQSLVRRARASPFRVDTTKKLLTKKTFLYSTSVCSLSRFSLSSSVEGSRVTESRPASDI